MMGVLVHQTGCISRFAGVLLYLSRKFDRLRCVDQRKARMCVPTHQQHIITTPHTNSLI